MINQEENASKEVFEENEGQYQDDSQLENEGTEAKGSDDPWNSKGIRRSHGRHCGTRRRQSRQCKTRKNLTGRHAQDEPYPKNKKPNYLRCTTRPRQWVRAKW